MTTKNTRNTENEKNLVHGWSLTETYGSKKYLLTRRRGILDLMHYLTGIKVMFLNPTWNQDIYIWGKKGVYNGRQAKELQLKHTTGISFKNAKLLAHGFARKIFTGQDGASIDDLPAEYLGAIYGVWLRDNDWNLRGSRTSPIDLALDDITASEVVKIFLHGLESADGVSQATEDTFLAYLGVSSLYKITHEKLNPPKGTKYRSLRGLSQCLSCVSYGY